MDLNINKCILAIVPLALFFCCNPEKATGKYSDSVTIYRDRYGVPHVHGVDDPSAVFGFAYAQAEDNFDLIENNFIRAIGRSAEVLGKKGVLDDWLNRSLEIVELSKKELTQLSKEVQEICSAYAAGLNFYLETHPEIQPQLLSKFEPWHPLAFIRYLYYQRVLLQYYANIPVQSFKNAFREINDITDKELMGLNFINKKISNEGSNSWAVNSKKSTSGNALLLINPHLSFFGPAQVYEAHIMSESGWNFSGYTRFGFPLPYVGFGEKLGWASTDNAADLVDTYREKIRNRKDQLAYEYDGNWRKVEEWKETIRIKEKDQLTSQELRFIRTHHGPVIGFQNNSYLSIKMAKYEDPGWLEQWFLMTKAKNLIEFKAATSRLDVQFGNYLYADVEGNILYVYNGAIPKRSEKFDWTNPVDGSNPETEWQGYHSVDELPTVLNPSSGWIQNCNGSPLLSTQKDNPKSTDFPNYMIRDLDNYRSAHSRRILASENSFTYESFCKKSYSTYLFAAEKELPELLEALNGMESKHRSAEMDEAIMLLNSWNYISTNSSITTTLYIHWRESLRRTRSSISKFENLNIAALEAAIDSLKKTWGTWKIPWGEINRIQRVEPDNNQEYHFDDSQPSIPIAGAPSWAGPIFTFWSKYGKTTKRRYGTGGNSYVSVIEFGPKVIGRSLHHFGTNGSPSSPHYFDQAEIYSHGKYKPAYLTLDEVRAHAVRSYEPSDFKR